MNAIWQDVRFALRQALKNPAFTLMAVLMLALGIGVNTAIFSIAYGVLLKPLSYPDPDRLVSLWPETPVNKLIAATVSEQSSAFSATSPYASADFPISGEGDPVIVRGARVGSQYFDVLRSSPQLGRTFAREENRPGQDHVVVLSNGLWQRRYGSDPSIIGRSVDIDGQAFTVVGVMPRDFRALPGTAELWTPLPIDPANEQDYLGSFYLELMGRLKPGVSQAQAEAELQSMARRLRDDHPNLMTTEKTEGARVASLHEQLVGNVKPTLMVLLGAVGVVLLTACANVANLLLVRATARRREIAVRSALGATPARVRRQVLTESLLLGFLGGLAGLAVAVLTGKALVTSLPVEMPRTGEIGISGPVLAFNLGVSLFAALLFGLAPARRATALDVKEELQEDGVAGGSLGRQGRRSGQALVVVQIAAATVLLIAAGLMLKSLGRLQSVDPGFRTEGLLTARLDLVESRYPNPAEKIEFYRRVTERVEGLPGVSEAGAIHLLPLTTDNWEFPYLAGDNPVPPNAPPGTPLPNADFRIVTPTYFGAMGIRLLQGRVFAETDQADAPPVGLINRTMAEQLWPTSDPIGKTIQMFGNGGPIFTVIGVVDDVHPDRLDASPRPTMYRPFPQWPNGSMYLVVRTAVEPQSLVLALSAAVREVDNSVPVSQIQPMTDVLRTSLSDERFTGLLIAAFAALALLLALMGVYSVISYTLARRTREFGIRMALGEQRRGIFQRVLREGFRLSGAGVVVGLFMAWAVTRLLASRLYGVSPTDVAAFVLSAACIIFAALVSCGLPAWRATEVAPMVALKRD